MEHLGRLLILFGLIIVILGVFFTFFGRIPWLGHLPGDIYIKRENFTFYFPLMTMLLLSIIFTIIINLIARR